MIQVLKHARKLKKMRDKRDHKRVMVLATTQWSGVVFRNFMFYFELVLDLLLVSGFKQTLWNLFRKSPTRGNLRRSDNTRIDMQDDSFVLLFLSLIVLASSLSSLFSSFSDFKKIDCQPLQLNVWIPFGLILIEFIYVNFFATCLNL